MNSKKTLAQVLSQELTNGQYDSDRAFKFKDVFVIAEYRTYPLSPDEKPSEHFPYKRFPGKHKFVYFWAELENGYAVGMNENPARGLSFPVVRMRAIASQKVSHEQQH